MPEAVLEETGLGGSRAGYAALDPCVHCGFCLPACPTYLATGDENDGPRGRIVLMRAIENGELLPSDPAVRQHLDACLGCRGCEPVCPSGVGYGRGLEAARADLARANGLGPLARGALAVFGNRLLWRLGFGVARLLRDTGIAERLAGGGRLGFAMGMVAATKGRKDGTTEGRNDGWTDRSHDVVRPSDVPSFRPSVTLFPGCVMSVLFRHVHAATRRALEANGYRVSVASGTVCCGAPHAHAGDLEGARALARRNVKALRRTTGWIVVNSAGCGAILKDYGHLLGSQDAALVAERVRDVSEVLADAGPRPGGPVPLRVAYDPPCHLQHAQRVHREVLAMLSAIPGLEVVMLPGAERCCGSAGVYNLLQPEMAEAVLSAKLTEIQTAASELDAVTTGNPGCLMQIGAGLRAAGSSLMVMHPVELLDRSYAAVGRTDGRTEGRNDLG
jgi:glycolate oxidase iron-sulfur subunit